MGSILPSDDSRSRDTFARQQHSSKSQPAQQQQLGRDARLQECSRLPTDWSLKTRAVFYSQQPFAVCRAAVMAPAGAGKGHTCSCCCTSDVRMALRTV